MDEKTKDGAVAQPKMPSDVTDDVFIYMPPEEEVKQNVKEFELCGKWILSFADGSMDLVDKSWVSLQSLLSDGTLIMLKAITSAKDEDAAPHIQCFTRPGICEIRRTAASIKETLKRSGVSFEGIMYYKLNEFSNKKIAVRFGHKNVCTYMYTFQGNFYKRELATSGWKLVKDGSSEKEISEEFLKENYLGSEDLLSKSRHNKQFWHAEHENSLPWWSITLSDQTDDDLYLAEADRVWIVAKQLFDEGIFAGISSYKNKSPQNINVRFYISEDLDVFSQIPLCDTIFKKASVEGIIYFTTQNDSNPTYHAFKYTSEGELYERRRFAEKYVFLDLLNI